MRELLDRLIAHIHWILFALLEVLSGLLLFQFNNYQGSVWFTQANTVAAQIYEWEAAGLAYIRLKDENANLTTANLMLQAELDSLRQKLGGVTADTTYTQKVQAELLTGTMLKPAKVVANSVKKKDNFLTINLGSLDGVREEMGVVSGTGVVGIVSKVTPHYALVMSILNSQSSISCRIRGTDYFGYLRWNGGNPLQGSMVDVPRHARARIGDVVETSGFSSVFPPGIFLGKVVHVHDSKDGMAYQLEIQLSTDLANIRNVCVVMDDRKNEIDSLRRQ